MSTSHHSDLRYFNPFKYEKELDHSLQTLEGLSSEFFKLYGQYELLNELGTKERLDEPGESKLPPSETTIQDCYEQCTSVLSLQEHYVNLETLIKTEEFVKETTDSLKEFIADQKNSLKVHMDQAQDTLRNAGIDANTGLLRQEKAYESFRETYINIAMAVLNKGKTAHIGVIFADLDNLKHHNALYGHPAMDTVIAEMGKTVNQSIKQKKDAAIRKGGDEFVVYMTSFDENGPETYVTKLHDAIHDIKVSLPGQQATQPYTPTATCGYDSLSVTYQDARSVETVLLEYNHKLKQAEATERTAILEERNTALNQQIQPLYQKSIQHANDAAYDAKIQGKDRIEEYSSFKEEIGYYDDVRALYNKIVRNEIKPQKAQKKAQHYLLSAKQQN